MQSEVLKNMKKRLVILLCGSLLLSSCCTLGYEVFYDFVDEEATPLVVDANVPQSSVYLNGKYVGVTPYTYWGNKADIRKITVKNTGYVPLTQKTKRKFDSAFLWNFSPISIFYFVPLLNPCWIWGSIVDLANKQVYEDYKQDFYYFELKKGY